MPILLLFFSNLIASVAIGIGMVIAPWLLGKTAAGGSLLAVSAMASSILMCLLMPWIGFIIDRTSSKLILFIQLVGMALACGLCFFAMQFNYAVSTALAGYFFASQIFFGFFYISRAALVKKAFDSQSQRKTNSLLEIEAQLSTFLTGGIALFFLSELPFVQTFAVLALILLGSAFCMWALPVTVVVRPQAMVMRQHFLPILKRHRAFLFFATVANTPFVTVLMCAIIFPILIHKELGLDIQYYAVMLVLYTIGAMVGGYLPSRLASYRGEILWLRGCLVVTCFSVLAIALFPFFWIILLMNFLLGCANAMAKVTYSNLTMRVAQHHTIGAFMAAVQTMLYILRFLLATGLGILLLNYDTSVSFITVFIFCLVGTIGLFASSKFILNDLEVAEAEASKLIALESNAV